MSDSCRKITNRQEKPQKGENGNHEIIMGKNSNNKIENVGFHSDVKAIMGGVTREGKGSQNSEKIDEIKEAEQLRKEEKGRVPEVNRCGNL